MSFAEHKANGLVYDTADGLTSAGGVRHAFTTRLGGVSPAPFDSLNFFESTGDSRENIIENYRLLGKAVSLDMSRAAANRQVHSNRVRVLRAEDAGAVLYADRPCDADALVTDAPELPLVVFSADCCTVLLYDPAARCVGAVHAGWRGTASGAVYAAVRSMSEAYGARGGNIRAAIGPSIGPCCFETDGDVPEALRGALGGDAEPCIRERGGKFYVDLKGLNRLWLLRAGLTDAHIEIHADCTACRPDRYWSHRKMGTRRGGQLAVIALEAAP